MKCKYTYEFPVDEWGRLGGLYSLADVPVKSYKKLEREGEIVAKDSSQNLYEIDDSEKNFSVVVPYDQVELINGD
jgi:hypothetical protein|tara:strand:+ start:761 stop:985 length:225 start_codon:yes stop_codon:yes gene_type:complete